MPEHPTVAVLGPASMNHLVYLDALPQPTPHMEFARDDYETLGGTSAGKALHLQDLGRPATTYVVVGDDTVGQRIVGTLTGAGVDVRPLGVPGSSERHLNLMTKAGERLSLYLSTPTSPEPVALANVVRGISTASVLVVDLAPWTRQIVAELGRTGIPIWVDLHDYDGEDDFRMPFIKAASYVFLNADRLGDPLPVMHRLIDDGTKIVVCTLGADGAVAVTARHGVHEVKAEPVERVVDTNGAGDGFFAGFLDEWLRGADIEAALAAGARQARRAIGSRHLSPLLDPNPLA